MKKSEILVKALQNEDIFVEILQKMRKISPSYRDAPDEAIRKSFEVINEALVYHWNNEDNSKILEWAQMRAKMAIELKFSLSAVLKALDFWMDAIQRHLVKEHTDTNVLQELLDQLKESFRLMKYYYIESYGIILEKTKFDLNKQTSITEAINKVFHRALTCESDMEVAGVCLTVAEEITGSKFGQIKITFIFKVGNIYSHVQNF